jgi:hypothetical protein
MLSEEVTTVFPDIDDFAKALESVFQGKATILDRMRLACSFYDSDLKKLGKEGDGMIIQLSLSQQVYRSLRRLASDERDCASSGI